MHTQLLLYVGSAMPFAAVAPAQSIRDQVHLNTTGLNLEGNDAKDGINVDEDPRDPGTFLLVWAEQNGTSQLTQDIYCARSTDNALTWSTPLRVDVGEVENLHDSHFPKVRFTADGTVIAVWEESRDAAVFGSATDDVYFNRSTDGGLTWMPAALPLNGPTAGSDVSSTVAHVWLDVDHENVNVTWEESPAAGGDDRIWYTRSEDSGATWSTPIPLTTGATDVDGPKVRGNDDLVHVVYIDDAAGGDDVHYLRSTDGGATWADPLVIEADPVGNADVVRLHAFERVLCAVWLDNSPTSPGGESVHGVVSVDAGTTWGAEVDLSPQVSAQPGADADWPHADIRGDRIFVVFASDAQSIASGSGGNECYVSYSLNGGETWTLETPLEPGVVAHRPLVVALPGVVVVRYEHLPDGSNVTAFAYSTDSGKTWTAAGEVVNAGPDVDEGNSPDEGPFLVGSPVTGAVVVGHFDRPLGHNEVYCSVFDAPVKVPPPPMHQPTDGSASKSQPGGL